MSRLTTIGFDADDTLWENEQFFRMTEARFVELLAGHADPDHLSERLLEAERRNLRIYGFGIKGFTLSMIETALEITHGDLPASAVRQIVEFGKEMLAHPIEPLPHAQSTLEALAGRFRLVLITKGDLFDQERKLAQSGLGDFFNAVEIVSEKVEATYETLFHRHGDGPGRALMVGNSMKSDILPAIGVGAWGVHVPHRLTWALEHAEAPEGHDRFRSIEDLSGLKAIIADILS